MSTSFYTPCKLLLYGASETGKRTLISRLLSVDSLAAYRLHKKDLRLNGNELEATGSIQLCGTTVHLTCIRSPRAGAGSHLNVTGVVILYDITNKSSLNHVERYTIEAQHAAPGSPVVLVGSKCDLHSPESLSSAEVERQLSVCWHHYSLHCQVSALQGVGMNTLIAAVLGVPFIKRRHAELARSSLEWSVTMEQAMLWAFDHNMNNLVIELKHLGMCLSPTVIQLHGNAIERHLVHMKPWQPVNVRAALRGTLSSNSWKKIVMLTEEQRKFTMNEADEEDLAELDRMTGCAILPQEEAFEVISEMTLAKSVQEEKERRLLYPESGYCVTWQSMALQGFYSAWLLNSCSGISSQAITHLNLSRNQLTYLPVDIYQLPNLLVLCASYNQLVDMPNADLWLGETNLQLLDLSHNCIRCFVNVETVAASPSPPLRRTQSEYSTSSTGGKKMLSGEGDSHSSSAIVRRRLSHNFRMSSVDRTSTNGLEVGRKRNMSVKVSGVDSGRDSSHQLQLWLVDLSHNHLQEIPAWLLNVQSLIHLDLSENPLERLPTTLSPSSNLHRLIVTQAKNVPRHIIQAGPVALLCQLRQNQSEATPGPVSIDRRLTVIVFGPEGSGKTRLLGKLTGKPMTSKPGVQFFRWKFRIPFDRMSVFQKQSALIDFWDFSGIDLYRPLHRCVHSHHALHIAVCNMVNRRQSCQQLVTYMIQLQAVSVEPLSVLVVFAQADACGQKAAEKEDAKKQCLMWINRLMSDDTVVDGVSWPANCRPHIIGYVFTSAVTGEGIHKLNAYLSSIVTGHGHDGLSIISTTALTLNLSLHCQQLEKVVREGLQNGRRRMPALVSAARLWEELCSPKQSNGMIFMNSQEELLNMLEQLHQCGLVLYYPLTLSSPALIMTQADLFCALINNLVKVSDKWARTTGNSQGVISEMNLVMALSEHLPGAEETINVPPDYLRIFEESGLCCHVGDNQIFLPSSLPTDCPSNLHSLQWPDQSHFRIFQLPYLSPLFWSALLIRLAKDFSKVIVESYKDDALVTENGMSVKIDSETAGQSKTSARQLVQFWREGMLLRLPDHCQVLLQPVDTVHIKGWSGPVALDLRVCGFRSQLHIKLLHVVTNAIVLTVKEQYPHCSLEGDGEFQCLISCPACLQNRVAQMLICHFSLTDCLMLLESWAGGDISKLGTPCPRQHMDIRLLDLIPDVLNSDLVCLLKHKAGRAQQLSHTTPNPSLATIVAAGSRKLSGGGVLVRKFLTNSTSMAMDELLRPYSALRWHAEALFELHQSAFCMEPVNLLPQPPILHVVRPPCGTLKDRLAHSVSGLRRRQIHEVLYQVVNAIIHLKQHGLTHCRIDLDRLFIISDHPLMIKLSDDGLQPQDRLYDDQPMVIQLGLLIYKLASGQELLHGMHSIKHVMVALEHGMLRPSLDGVMKADASAAGVGKTQSKAKSFSDVGNEYSRLYDSARLSRRHFTSSLKRARSSSAERDSSRVSGVGDVSGELAGRPISQCSKLCMQVMIEQCLCQSSVEMGSDGALFQVQKRLPLCSSATQWSPAVLPHNVTCTALHLPRKCLLWATAVPWLQLGSLDLLTGHVNEHCLSFLPKVMPHLRYKHRFLESEERATAMAVVESAGQLWVGVEKSSCGAVYVFDVVSLELLDSTDLEGSDAAVLSVLVVSANALHHHKQLVLVGLACGDVLVFLASLHDSRSMVLPTQQCLCRARSETSQPCMALAQSGSYVICSFGNYVIALDPSIYLQSRSAELSHPTTAASVNLTKVKPLADILTGEDGSCVDRRYHRLAIMRLVTCPLGVWFVQRHSSLLFLLDAQLQHCKAVVDCREVADIDDPVEAYITAVAAAGSLVWVGTRGGHIVLLNGQTAVSVWNGHTVLSAPSVLIGLRRPLPGCAIRHLIALPDGALLSADAGLCAQAVCSVERKITTTRNCVGVFVLDIAVQSAIC